MRIKELLLPLQTPDQLAILCTIASAKLSRIEVLSRMSGSSNIPVSLNAALAFSSCSSQSSGKRGTAKTTGHPDDLEAAESEDDKMSVSNEAHESDESSTDYNIEGVE